MKMQGMPYMPRHRSGGEISFFLITDCKCANRPHPLRYSEQALVGFQGRACAEVVHLHC
jgi:hypothetical protein